MSNPPPKIARPWLQREIQLIHRRGAMLHDDLVGGLFGMALSVFVEEPRHQRIAVTPDAFEPQIDGDAYIVFRKGPEIGGVVGAAHIRGSMRSGVTISSRGRLPAMNSAAVIPGCAPLSS